MGLSVRATKCPPFLFLLFMLNISHFLSSTFFRAPMSIYYSTCEEGKFAEEYKVVIVGESYVGKTSILYNYVQATFKENLISTVGLDFRSIILDVTGIPVKLQIWDTAGQERFRTLSKQLFRGAKGIVLVYDITNKNSFFQLNHWIKSFDRYEIREEQVLIIGNKVDLAENREISESVARKLAQDYSFNYIETSAKDGTNIQNAFHVLATELNIKFGIFRPGRLLSSTQEDIISNVIESPTAISPRKIGECNLNHPFRSIFHSSGIQSISFEENCDPDYYQIERARNGRIHGNCCNK